jgi:hypothetical protein
MGENLLSPVTLIANVKVDLGTAILIPISFKLFFST